jgi:hypothetical protein
VVASLVQIPVAGRESPEGEEEVSSEGLGDGVRASSGVCRDQGASNHGNLPGPIAEDEEANPQTPTGDREVVSLAVHDDAVRGGANPRDVAAPFVVGAGPHGI